MTLLGNVAPVDECEEGMKQQEWMLRPLVKALCAAGLTMLTSSVLAGDAALLA